MNVQRKENKELEVNQTVCLLWSISKKMKKVEETVYSGSALAIEGNDDLLTKILATLTPVKTSLHFQACL